MHVDMMPSMELASRCWLVGVTGEKSRDFRRMITAAERCAIQGMPQSILEHLVGFKPALNKDLRATQAIPTVGIVLACCWADYKGPPNARKAKRLRGL